ncbi:MAG: hypothetical protein HQ402_02670 [Parcubacteria group bacterium]|nr:hypothetical protein [Parcubacteria group bacterium]
MAKVLDRTKDKMGATSRREVVQEAINVLDIIAQNQGKEVAFQMTDSGAILITKPKTQSES